MEAVGVQGPWAHLEGQVGSNGDPGTQVDVATFVTHQKHSVPLGLGSHADATAVLRARLQPSCKKSAGWSL